MGDNSKESQDIQGKANISDSSILLKDIPSFHSNVLRSGDSKGYSVYMSFILVPLCFSHLLGFSFNLTTM